MNHPIHEDEEGPGLLMNWTFWAGGLASLAVWTAIWVGLADFIDWIPLLLEAVR